MPIIKEINNILYKKLISPIEYNFHQSMSMQDFIYNLSIADIYKYM